MSSVAPPVRALEFKQIKTLSVGSTTRYRPLQLSQNSEFGTVLIQIKISISFRNKILENFTPLSPTGKTPFWAYNDGSGESFQDKS